MSNAEVLEIFIRKANGETIHLAREWAEIERHSPPRFSYDRRTWFVDPRLRSTGKPAYYNENDARPIKMPEKKNEQ